MERSPTILYVDDDEALVRLIQRGLSRRGYSVEGATTIEDGLARLAKGDIDVVALDHFLAAGTGMEFLAAMATTPSRPPVVYVTAADDITVAVEALKAGAADYVPKVVGEDFLELLRRAMDQALRVGRLQRERERAERETREALELAEARLHEMNHRVANSLTLVSAMVRMQASRMSDRAAVAALSQVEARIAAIGGVHRLLYTSGDVKSVDMRNYLTRLITELDETSRRPGLSITAETPDNVKILTDKAVSVGVLVTELVTNAVKYAYPEGGGEIRVQLRPIAERKVELVVEDDGVGWNGAALAKGTGIGSRLIAAMAMNLGTTVRYGDGPGCNVMIAFDI